MVNLGLGLQGRGIPVELALAAARGPYLADVSDKLKVMDLGAERVLASVPALARYLRNTQPDVLIATLQSANLVALWARRLAGVETRVYLREANMLSVGAGTSVKERAILQLVKLSYPWADGIIAVSKGVEEDVRAFTGATRTFTVYNPVVDEGLLIKKDAPLEHPWFSGMAPVVLGVGRLTRQKDFATLIRAFALLRRDQPAKLMILGEGEEREALSSLMADLGLQDDVALPGFVENPFAYMARASVFVLSSAWEGLPGVLIQALACGCPVVSTDCPSGPAEILEKGRYGLLVPVGDAEAMARAVVQTLEAPPPKETLLRRGLDFSVERSLEQYMACLKLSDAVTA